jgi:hypothetical protein
MTEVHFSAGAMIVFLFATASRPALGPTQTSIQGVPETVIPGLKRSGNEDDHLPSPGAEVKKTWSYTSLSPILPHGVLLI